MLFPPRGCPHWLMVAQYPTKEPTLDPAIRTQPSDLITSAQIYLKLTLKLR
jgi:hypothetical protein